MKPISILIVEDNPSDVFLAQSALEELDSYDITLIVANDGEAGLKALLNDDFDLAFIDYNLPKYDGHNILGKVSEEIRERCFMLTTSDADTHILTSRQLKIAGYITKPLHQEDFIRAINSVVHITLSKDVKFFYKG